MTEQELIEFWRKEFELTVTDPLYLRRLPSGTYSWDQIEWCWAGFQRAKRSQPVVELPNVDHCSGSFKRGFYHAVAYFEIAGINYRIKGE